MWEHFYGYMPPALLRLGAHWQCWQNQFGDVAPRAEVYGWSVTIHWHIAPSFAAKERPRQLDGRPL
jgi:hypothetical protein